MKAIIGAVLIDGQAGPPVSNSVVVVAGDRIRAAGAASTVPIPAEADKIDGSGKFLVPRPVDVYPRADAAASFPAGRPASPDQARARVAKLAQSNAEQVAKARRLIEELGYQVATPKEAREILALKGADRTKF